MATGKVQQWDEAQGEGKIKEDQAGAQLEFSSQDLAQPTDRMTLRRGDKVQFRVDEPGHAADIEKA
ncbi:hypothetical protein [Streptomyces roseochromogenus]|uniref:CSD domain-containing protein n=1 Tax=Streptomyces roseochromogenus subsp. oscitans DS 12.976 TaxID=1352936 RepID=V6K6R3_STRRC|nr:hypothetical protein [Streptomyces roseochromogenus]EST27812.1 hypothetical protein M878_24125 [Streptomyces roseochromogenus subsp. oscitans DS 12.976]